LQILEIQHLNKSFGKTKALSDINIKIPKGIIFGILGPNGAGKTTLIRIINQIIDSDSGTILFKNETLKRNHISQIGYLPEERGLYKKMKVWDQLIYFARLKGMSGQDAKQKVNEWLEKMDVINWRDKRIDDLSKGMAQKIQFISTVIHEPELLILDEPFSGFDPLNAEIIKDQILELKQKGISLLLSTHRMESVELLCDEVAMFNKSEKILDGTLEKIKNQFSSHEFEIKIKLSGEDYPSHWELVSDGEVKTFRVALENLSPNDFLLESMKIGQIHQFKEIMPTMEQIFIQQVKKHSDG
jgi:ABC-2 type transport system ATP-binding protein